MDRSPRRVLNALGDRPRLCCLIFAPSAIVLPSSWEKPIPLLAGTSSRLSEKQRAPQRSSVSRRPALGLSVAQPNPSVANCVRSNYSVNASTKPFTAGSASRAAGGARLIVEGFMILDWVAGTVAARRYKLMTAWQKNGDVSVAIM